MGFSVGKPIDLLRLTRYPGASPYLFGDPRFTMAKMEASFGGHVMLASFSFLMKFFATFMVLRVWPSDHGYLMSS